MNAATIVTTLLTLIQTLLSQLGSTSGVANQIIAALIQIVPLVVTLGTDVVNSVKSVISVLENSGDLTTDQLNTLASLSADLDTSWSSTIAAYNASKGISPAPVVAPVVITPTVEDSAQAALPLSLAPAAAQ